MDESQQELMFKLSMFEQQIKHLQQQIQAVEQGILEMNTLSLGLDELKGTTGNEIFAPIGRGIFAKAKLLSEELTVDIGGGNFVTKSIPDTKKIIEEQVEKLKNIKKELENNLENVGKELEKVMIEGQKEHIHEKNCGCEEEGQCNCEGKECDCGDECKCE
jgi:prefoldin alpha subunit